MADLNREDVLQNVKQRSQDIYMGDRSALLEASRPTMGSYTPTFREMIAANSITGRALEPLVRTKGVDIGLLDLAGGPVGAGVAGMDVRDVTVRDAGPVEKTAVYATAPLAAIPLVGKPISKGARTVAKSIDNLMGMNKRPFSEVLAEAEQAGKVSSEIVDEIKNVAPEMAAPAVFKNEDTYEYAKRTGKDPTDVHDFDPLDIRVRGASKDIADVKRIVSAKADAMRYNNPNLKRSLIGLFNADPDNYMANMDNLTGAADYLSDWALKWSLGGKKVLGLKQLMAVNQSSPYKITAAQYTLEKAKIFGNVGYEDAQSFIRAYSAVADHEEALFYMTKVATYNKLSRGYSAQLRAARELETANIHYGNMSDKDFFRSYAQAVPNPYRAGSNIQPELARTSKEIEEFTGEKNPLVFVHGTTKAFDKFKPGTPAYMTRVQDGAGIHVGTPSQAALFSRGKGGRSIPVVLKKTRKLNEVLDELGDEYTFDAASEFLENSKNMKNGVLTEDGIDRLNKLMGGNDAYNVSQLEARRFVNKLSDKGVTYIPYINAAEDTGDLSVWVLKPEYAKRPTEFTVEQAAKGPVQKNIPTQAYHTKFDTELPLDISKLQKTYSDRSK